jgi:hypothetical protein
MNDQNSFNLEKMEVSLVDGLAHYTLVTKSDRILMNPLVGKHLKLTSFKEIHCCACGKKTNKSYSGGYCYPCSIKLAECDLCILKPELCHFKKGTCRDASWGEANCNIPHYVYLANSSGLKVGITRTTQVPIRFIDQGAVEALPILKVGSRHLSGIFEKLFSSEVKDKTDWRKMLKGDISFCDLENSRDELFELFGDDIDQIENEHGSSNVQILEKESVIKIKYPVLKYPEKVSSLSFEKNEEISGHLQGIKGQYLIFDTGVINLRSFTGYKINITEIK